LESLLQDFPVARDGLAVWQGHFEREL
jgi:hypothetical protein